jgi:mannose-P-dolichol utilization defect protein 1
MASVERCVGEFRETITSATFPTSECVKFGVSKCLSLGIVAGAVLVKVPQINRILANGSAKGLRVSMFLSEVLSGTVAIAYFARSGISIAAYAELFFILIQNLVILVLIAGCSGGTAANGEPSGTKKNAFQSHLAFSPETAPAILTYVAIVAAFVVGEDLVSNTLLETLYNGTTLLLICGRAPQIYQNHVEKSTGELSMTSQFLMSVGSAARIFTTAQEGGGFSMLLAYTLSAGMNWILFAQIFVFSSSGKKASSGKRKTN